MEGKIKKYKYVLFVIFIGIAYWVISYVFPKNLNRFPIYLIIFFLDLYLWKTFSSSIYKKKAAFKYIVITFYWLPLLLVIFISTISLFYPLQIKNTPLYTYLFGIVFITYTPKIIASIFVLINDFIRMINYVWVFTKTKRRKTLPREKRNIISRSKFIKKLSLLTGGALFGTFLIGQFKWVFDFKIRRCSIPLKNLPQTFNDFKIIHLSDLHLGSFASKKPLKELVEMVNDLNPDVIFFTGDLVNFSSLEAIRFEDHLKWLKAKYGIFSILGNHDYGDYVNWESSSKKKENLHQLFDLYKRLGWKLLRNSNAFIKKNKQKIAILGVENWGAFHRFPKLGNVNKALEGVNSEMIKILLSHDPSHWEKIVSKKHPDIQLTLSGHTHGFQFGIETKAFRWSPAQYLYKYWAGLFKIKNQYLYVNRGTGFLAYPGRVGISPEITEIILRSTSL